MFEWMDAAGDFVMGGVVSTLSVFGMGPTEPAAYGFDPLLEGLAQDCSVSPDLGAMWEQVLADGTLIVPADAQPHVMAPQFAVHDDYREVHIPVEGTWRDYPLDGIVIISGLDNGISSIGVTFAEPAPGLAETFTTLAHDAQTRLTADPENMTGVTAAFGHYAYGSSYICDFSN